MFLRAGVLSLLLLLASRLLGLVRESAQAAAFGASALADVAVLMLTLPDWLTGVLAAGALAYVLLPAWAHQDAASVAASQRRVARALLLGGTALGLLLVALHGPALGWLVPGLPQDLHGDAAPALAFSGAAVPMALLAALLATRLQHERDFVGLYAANLVVNAVLIATLLVAAQEGDAAIAWLGAGLLVAMVARLAWLRRRQVPFQRAAARAPGPGVLPAPSVWVWAAAAAGLPLALPFVARSLASQQGPGSLAVFNYAWKLVELPLVLAVQLVGTLVLGTIAQAVRSGATGADAAAPVRRGFALAWTLACACAAGLLVAAPAVAQLLFGWGRMQAEALEDVALWGSIGAWSLLPQALLTIALAVLAAQQRMRVAVFAYAGALALLLVIAPGDGAQLMLWLGLLLAGVAAAVLAALRATLAGWLPWPALGAAAGALVAVQVLLVAFGGPSSLGWQWAGGIAAGAAVIGLALLASRDLRAALAR
ncbi:MAG: lipid II flippase MurJ [Ramlibacter sp.]